MNFQKLKFRECFVKLIDINSNKIFINCDHLEEDRPQTSTEAEVFCPRCEKIIPESEFFLHGSNCNNDLNDNYAKRNSNQEVQDPLELPESVLNNTEERSLLSCPQENCTPIFDEKSDSSHAFLIQSQIHKSLVYPTEDHKCLNCGKLFSPLENAQIHNRICVKTHSVEEIFPCPINGCKSSFATNRALERHKRSVHVQTVQKCPYPNCEKYFKPVCVRQHVNRVHKRKMKQCENCDEILKSHCYKSHLLKCLGRREKTIYKCCFPECLDQVFGDQKSAKLHALEVHNLSGEQDENNQEKEEQHLFCSVKGCTAKRFGKQKALDYHTRIFHGLESDIREQCPIQGCKTICKITYMRQHITTFHEKATPVWSLPEEIPPEINTEHIIPDNFIEYPEENGNDE